MITDGMTRHELSMWSQGLYAHAKVAKADRETSAAVRARMAAERRAEDYKAEVFHEYVRLRRLYDFHDREPDPAFRERKKVHIARRIERMEEDHRDFRAAYQRLYLDKQEDDFDNAD